jgi:hypothetical protein
MRRRDALGYLGLAATAGRLQLEETDGDTGTESGLTVTSTDSSGTEGGGIESDDEYDPEPPAEPVSAGELRWEFQAKAALVNRYMASVFSCERAL